MGDFVLAVTNSIQLITFPLEKVNFSNNGLTNESGTMILDALKRHVGSIKEINFSYNKFTY